MRKTYVQKAFNFLKKNHYITHKIIQKKTHCNDSYSVMEAIKLRLKKEGIPLFSVSMRNTVTNTPFTHYYIEVA